MDIYKIIIASIIGTIFMTGFSYLISKIFNKLYKEPVLLNYLLEFMKIDINQRNKRFSGWVIHYIIGLAFVILYDILWRNHIQMSWLSALFFGAISGIIGILSWIVMFYQIDNKLKIDYLGYYTQLFFAHIIFAIAVFMLYKNY